MDRYHILLVDNEAEIVDLMEIYLKNEDYAVHKANSGEEALAVLKDQPIHLVVLDIMMPGIDGLEVCRRIRADRNIPIIMLSAKSQDMDKILGLGTGADDYMVKPFNPMELIARIKSQLRRFLYLNENRKSDDHHVRIRELSINKNNHAVTVFGNDVSLTPTEYGILLLLAGNPGRVFSAEEIFERVWQEKYYESNNTVMAHIWRLREKIEENPREPKIVETVWGVGYKIEE